MGKMCQSVLLKVDPIDKVSHSNLTVDIGIKDTITCR